MLYFSSFALLLRCLMKQRYSKNYTSVKLLLYLFSIINKSCAVGAARGYPKAHSQAAHATKTKKERSSTTKAAIIKPFRPPATALKRRVRPKIQRMHKLLLSMPVQRPK